MKLADQMLALLPPEVRASVLAEVARKESWEAEYARRMAELERRKAERERS